MSDAPRKPPSYPRFTGLQEPKSPLPPRVPGPEYHDTKEIPAFKGGTPETALMGEMMRRIETMNQDLLKSVDSKLQDALNKHSTTSMQAHETTRKHVVQLTNMVKVLWTSVKGSDPPPPPTNGGELSFSMSEPIVKAASAVPPLDEKVSSHDESIASVQGQLIAVSSTANETKAQVEELLRLQKEQMGKHEDDIAAIKRVADTVRWLMFTSDGRKSLMLFLLFAVTVYDKIRGLVHG